MSTELACPRSPARVICFALVLLACTPDNGEQAEQAESETNGTEVGPETESGDGDGDTPELCETLQQEPSGVLTDPTDLQARCDPDSPGVLVALHRPESVACTTEPAPIDPCVDPGGECQFDNDCEAIAAGGRCASFDGLGGLCSCVLPCTSDDDCPADRACLCRSAVYGDNGNTTPIVSHTGCWSASCRTAADCEADEECAMATYSCGTPRLACRGPSDACQDDLDCVTGSNCTPTLNGNSWLCLDNSSCQ
jgi:hypothetical protein